MRLFMVYVGLFLFGGGFIIATLGRFSRIITRLRKDEASTDKSFKAILVGFLMVAAGALILFGLPQLID